MIQEQKEQEMELLFQASGSMKLLRVWMERVAKQTVHTWDDNLAIELANLKEVVNQVIGNVAQLQGFCKGSAATESFCDKMHELLIKIDTKEMRVIQTICATIQNQLDYIVNDLEKKRKRLYEVS